VHVYAIITWAAAGIALLVFAVLAVVLVRFRAGPGAPLPAQTRGHTLLELGWTIAPALVLLVISIPTLQVIFRTQAAPPAQALEVTVLGHQWWWEFRYPTLGIATANELHLPAGRPAVLRLEGPDVIHSFWVPQLGGKRDGVPGPDLTTFGSRRTLAAGMVPNTPANVAAWVQNPGALKPGVKMPALGLTDDQARAVATYLESLQ